MAPTREELEKEEEALCEVLQAAEDLMQCAPARHCSQCVSCLRACAHTPFNARVASAQGEADAARGAEGGACGRLPTAARRLRTQPCADSSSIAAHALLCSHCQGWFNLARARYQMGAGAVGRMQYDNNMAADVRLTAGDGAHVLGPGCVHAPRTDPATGGAAQRWGRAVRCRGR
jgi:hypothetical protein